MNYIKQLQQENQQLKDQIANTKSEVNLFAEHLALPKFQGSCPIDGSRKDWISTSDAIEWINKIRYSINYI